MIAEKQTSKPEFTWHKVDCELRIKKTSHYLKIPLKPTLNFALQDSQNHIQTKLHIDIQKSLQFQDSIGWNWHKSSNLPVFSIKLSIFKQFPGAFINPPSQLQANIYAVKIVQNTFQKQDCLYLQDIGIKGENQIKLNDGCGYFNGLKFSSTSYNNEGVKFHLLIVVYKPEEKNEFPTNIVCSVISPPIFVDSRKSARNYQEKKYLSFVELFNPSQLQKLFSKRQNKEITEEKKLILNNDEGLFNYLTAPNIRHKVKHPLFLAVKFSSALQILFNPKSKYFSQKQTTLNCIITRLQKKLIKEVGMLKRSKNTQSNDEKQFAIVLNFDTMSESEKIFDMLEYLDCQSIGLFEKSKVHKNFIDIFQMGEIVEVYKQEYNSLRKKSEKQINEMKSKRAKNDDDENNNMTECQGKQQTLFDKIVNKEEDVFSASNPIPTPVEIEKECLSLEKAESKVQSLRALGLSFKKLKPNENELSRNEQFIRFPLNEEMEQKFAQEKMNLENYQNNSLNFYAMYNQENSLVKSERKYFIQYVSREEVEYKIKEMCVQVYQRNKKSILHYLEALKKSNIKWKVKDVEQFIFSYSSALMDAIHYRERLLHHMFLENQILKAKVGVMQQMALTDLDKIKGNIFSMNKYLPEKFIIEKLRQNQLWSEELQEKNDNEANKSQIMKVAEVKAIEAPTKPLEIKVENHSSSSKQSERMIEEASSSDRDSLGCECNFVSNVFELPSHSPSIRQ